MREYLDARRKAGGEAATGRSTSSPSKGKDSGEQPHMANQAAQGHAAPQARAGMMNGVGNQQLNKIVADQQDQVQPEGSKLSQTINRGFSGKPKTVPYRSEMEQSFGKSFSGVNAYLGGSAKKASRDLDTEAFALGNKMGFASENPPKEMVAHELAHVMQQDGPTDAAAAKLGQVGDEAEKEANYNASTAMAGKRVAGIKASSFPKNVVRRWAYNEHKEMGDQAAKRAGIDGIDTNKISRNKSATKELTTNLVAKSAGRAIGEDSKKESVFISFGSGTAIAGDYNTKAEKIGEGIDNIEKKNIKNEDDSYESIRDKVVLTSNINHFLPVNYMEYQKSHKNAITAAKKAHQCFEKKKTSDQNSELFIKKAKELQDEQKKFEKIIIKLQKEKDECDKFSSQADEKSKEMQTENDNNHNGKNEDLSNDVHEEVINSLEYAKESLKIEKSIQKYKKLAEEKKENSEKWGNAAKKCREEANNEENKGNKYLKDALLQEAFGQHFLQDCYAAGHMAPRALDRTASKQTTAKLDLIRSKVDLMMLPLLAKMNLPVAIIATPPTAVRMVRRQAKYLLDKEGQEALVQALSAKELPGIGAGRTSYKKLVDNIGLVQTVAEKQGGSWNEAALGSGRSLYFHDLLNGLKNGLPTDMGRMQGDFTWGLQKNKESIFDALGNSLKSIVDIIESGTSNAEYAKAPKPDLGQIYKDEHAGPIWKLMTDEYKQDLENLKNGTGAITTQSGLPIDREKLLEQLSEQVFSNTGVEELKSKVGPVVEEYAKDSLKEMEKLSAMTEEERSSYLDSNYGEGKEKAQQKIEENRKKSLEEMEKVEKMSPQERYRYFQKRSGPSIKSR